MTSSRFNTRGRQYRNAGGRPTQRRLLRQLPLASAISAILAGGAPVVVHAADADTNGGTLEEVVVTAQKVSQNLQNVPISIEAISNAKLEQLNIVPPQERIRLPAGLTGMAVHLGGPVETGRGFVLHSADYFKAESTLPIDESVCLTATIDILRDIAKGTGPDKALLALGYAGWAPGQLESEIQANGWLNCPADPEIIFDPQVDRKYTRALGKIGIDPIRLVNDAGHA